MKSLIVIALIILSQYCNTHAQDVQMTEQVIKSIQFFTNGIVYKQNTSLDEKMEASLTGFMNNARRIKNSLSSKCFVQLSKMFEPALKYIDKKDYAGLIKWLFATKNIYCTYLISFLNCYFIVFN